VRAALRGESPVPHDLRLDSELHREAEGPDPR